MPTPASAVLLCGVKGQGRFILGDRLPAPIELRDHLREEATA